MTTPYWELISEYGVKAGERIAELERDLENAKQPRGRLVPGRVTEIINPAKPYILRKQAEAFDQFIEAWRSSDEAEEWFTVTPEGLKNYADSLRQQADELEFGQ